MLKTEITYRDILGSNFGPEGIQHPLRVIDCGVRTVCLHLRHKVALLIKGKAHLGIEGSIEQSLGIGFPHQAEVHHVVVGIGQEIHGGSHRIVTMLHTAYIGIQSVLRRFAPHTDITEQHAVEFDLRDTSLQTEILGVVINETLNIDSLAYLNRQEQKLLQGTEVMYLEVCRTDIIGMLVPLGAIAAHRGQIAMQMREHAVVERLVGKVATHRPLHEIRTEREHLFFGVSGIERNLLDDIILGALMERKAVETHKTRQMIDIGPHSIGIDAHTEMLVLVHLYQIHRMKVKAICLKSEPVGRSDFRRSIAAFELETSIRIFQTNIATH